MSRPPSYSAPHSAALLGALVADAASMGLHWLYDPQRIAEVTAQTGAIAFCPNKAEHFDGAKGYYAHAARHDGQFTQYGEAAYLAAKTIADKGTFDVSKHQQEFVAHFGAGGAFNGYIDRPTRGTLENIAAEKLAPSGIDDDQHPAIATLPALIAAGQDNLLDAMQITNVNDVAAKYSTLLASLLRDVLNGTPVQDALTKTANGTPLLQAALDTDETNSVAYGEVTNRACHLPQGIPLAFHIMRHSSSYTDAVETNILAGGDSAGRSLIIGAVMGAAHGIATPNGIPLAWILKTDNNAEIWRTIQKIT
jgi:hypothetical protein